MKVFITGGTGFVGKAVIKSLVKADFEVYANYRSNPLKLKHEKLKWVNVNLEEAGEIGKMLRENEIDVFINLIGIIKEVKGQTFENLHYQYPKRFIKVAKEIGIDKFIQMSALGVGDKIDTGYFEYKEKAEMELLASGLKYSIIRPSMIFGEGDESVNMFNKIIKTFHVFPLLSWGNYGLQPVSLDEVATAFLNAVRGDYDNKVVEIGGPKIYRFKELLKELAKINKTFVLTIPFPDFLSRLIAKLGDKLSFIPITSNMLKMLKAGNYLKEEKKNFDLIQIIGEKGLE